MEKTIEILESAAEAVCQHRRQFDSELSRCYQREQALRQAFFQRHQNNPKLRRQVMELLDAQCDVECLEQELYFRLGLQMGLELGSLDLLSPN